jgi:glycosyltransferase involved in cell wall biosynthesis
VKILFVHNALRSFVAVDRDLLATEHEVDELDLSKPSRLLTLPHRLIRADVVYCWFASLHALLPVLAAAAVRKPAIVVVGGYDTANMPEINYGHMAHPLKRHVVRAVCRSATGLIVNSRAAQIEVQKHVAVDTPTHVIHHGFTAPSSHPAGKREAIAVTAGIISRESLQRKGHETFVRAAELVPEARFVLVGQCQDDAASYLRSIAASNVEIPGFLQRSELDNLFDRAAVYVQVSAHEGFGCALAEAMAAGCMPVVSNQSALAEVVGSHGVFVNRSDISSVAQGIRQALAGSPLQRMEVADHIMSNFSMEQRRKSLLALIENVAPHKPKSPSYHSGMRERDQSL